MVVVVVVVVVVVFGVARLVVDGLVVCLYKLCDGLLYDRLSVLYGLRVGFPAASKALLRLSAILSPSGFSLSLSGRISIILGVCEPLRGDLVVHGS